MYTMPCTGSFTFTVVYLDICTAGSYVVLLSRWHVDYTVKRDDPRLLVICFGVLVQLVLSIQRMLHQSDLTFFLRHLLNDEITQTNSFILKTITLCLKNAHVYRIYLFISWICV